jgi:uncharacterized protein (DUF1015 family)
MATIKPLRGLRYNPKRFPDLSTVVAPPYDVLSEAERAAYCARDEHNIVRLTLGPEPLQDDPPDARYEQAARDLRRWMEEGVLVSDERPAIYPLETVYEVPEDMRLLDEGLVRQGFACLLELEPLGERHVFPHEGTLPGPKRDRLRLLRACRAAFEQILLLYSDPEGATLDLLRPEGDPPFALRDDDGVEHRLWAMHDEDRIRALADAVRDRPVVIADGHHRYETALAYRREMHAQGAGPGPWDYVLVCLCNADAGGVTILPSHRALEGVPPGATASFAQRAVAHFGVEALPVGTTADATTIARRLLDHMREAPPGECRLGFYAGRDRTLVLSARSDSLPAHLFPARMSGIGRSLDVVVLHEVVIKRLLDFEPVVVEGACNIHFRRQAANAIAWVDECPGRVALLVNPARVEQVIRLALAGERMPQKGTYFYPKLLSGTVMYRWD